MLNEALMKESEKPTPSVTCHPATDSTTERSGVYEDTFPDGGRGWVVVLGGFILITVTLGWG